MTLRLFDPAKGRVREVTPAITRVLRIGAGDGVRVAIVADLLRRLADRERWQTAVFGVSSLTDRQLLYLNVHPFHEPGPEVQVRVHGAAAAADISGTAREVVVAGPEGPPPVPPGLDPLAARLALLRLPYRETADLGPADVTAAATDLDRWRGLVAAWAELPSAAMAGVDPVIERLQDDLDTPGALAALDALAADDSIPPGARFEAFAHLDRLLGLDLASEVGRRST
jgi:hypothetical protein